MDIKIINKSKKEGGILAVPFFKEYAEKFPQSYSKDLKALVKRALDNKEFKGKFAEEVYFTVDAKDLPEKVLFIGCGSREKFDAKSARNIGAEICSSAKSFKQQKVIVLMTPETNLYVEEIVEGIALKNYRISKYKTGEEFEKERKKEIKEIILITDKGEKARKEAEKALVIAQAVNIAKDLVNGPANITDADYFGRIAKQLSKDYGYKTKVFDKDKLVKDGWGGLLAINQGSYKPAKCVIIEYYGGKKNDRPIVLTGKGIIFDTGGYNLKPTKFIEDMHSDKSGAATLIGVFAALKELGIKQNVIAVLPLAENMVDGKALRPDDIITMLNGKTVEITNTDAEGRVILGDALSHGAKYNPKYLIDIATLTGASIYALGDRYSALYSNDKELEKRLVDAGNEVDEYLWAMPLDREHKDKMKSHVADLRNGDEATAHLAGGSKGAAFLSFFIEDHKWAHIDIAGTAYTRDPKKYEQMGGTGVGVRVMLRFLETL
jgi:leucyl aminopeptidase